MLLMGRGIVPRLLWARARVPGLASISIQTVADMVKKVANSQRLRVKPAEPCSWLRARTTARAAPPSHPITPDRATAPRDRRPPSRRLARKAMSATPASELTRRHPVSNSVTDGTAATMWLTRTILRQEPGGSGGWRGGKLGSVLLKGRQIMQNRLCEMFGIEFPIFAFT